MGNDGGSIPKRSEILNFSLKKHSADTQKNLGDNKLLNSEKLVNEILNVYRRCYISGKILETPIVADCYGNLYNKEEIYQALLKRKKEKRASSSIEGTQKSMLVKSVNDLVDVNAHLDKGILECPVSGIKIDIENDTCRNINDIRFSYIVPCGCLINSKTLNNLISETKNSIDEKCPVCNTAFEVTNVIEINPKSDILHNRLKQRINKLQENGKYHNLKEKIVKKKNDKAQKRKTEDASADGVQTKKQTVIKGDQDSIHLQKTSRV